MWGGGGALFQRVISMPSTSQQTALFNHGGFKLDLRSFLHTGNLASQARVGGVRVASSYCHAQLGRHAHTNIWNILLCLDRSAWSIHQAHILHIFQVVSMFSSCLNNNGHHALKVISHSPQRGGGCEMCLPR